MRLFGLQDLSPPSPPWAMRASSSHLSRRVPSQRPASGALRGFQASHEARGGSASLVFVEPPMEAARILVHSSTARSATGSLGSVGGDSSRCAARSTHRDAGETGLLTIAFDFSLPTLNACKLSRGRRRRALCDLDVAHTVCHHWAGPVRASPVPAPVPMDERAKTGQGLGMLKTFRRPEATDRDS